MPPVTDKNAASAFVPAPRLRALRHWGLIAEAGIALTVAAAATKLLPFRRYIALGSRPLGRQNHANRQPTAPIVKALADRAPFRAVCLQRGLALQWLLRRRGIDAMLHYGIKLGADADMEAHVWVSHDGDVLIGAPQHQDYTEVARYPAKSA